MSLLDLPPTPATVDPVILPGLLTGLGVTTVTDTVVTRRPVPAWITDPDAITSISLGLVDIDPEFMARDEPSLPQIRRRITAWLCFYTLVYRARVAELEQRVAAAGGEA